MPITTDIENFKTICACDWCGTLTQTNRGDGVAPAGWVTGQLWLDLSLQEQKQVPLVFCQTCGPAALEAADGMLSAILSQFGTPGATMSQGSVPDAASGDDPSLLGEPATVPDPNQPELPL